MKHQSEVLSLSIMRMLEASALVLLVLFAVVAGKPAHAILDGATPATKSMAAPAAADSNTKQGSRSDVDWQPPVAPKVVIPSPVTPEQAEKLAEEWGVKLISISVTSAGFMMDFRFRVLDVDKALTLFDHRIKPYLIVERSSIKLPVPMAAKVGALRPTNRGKNIKADRNYYMIFANPDRHVKSGEKVTVVIGDFKVEHLTVN